MEAISTRPAVDQLVEYHATAYRNDGLCRLRVFDDARVAVVTDLLQDNPGASVTNAIEDVAMAIERLLDVRFFGTSWRLVQHYPPRGYTGFLARPVVELVTFSGCDRAGRLLRPTFLSVPPAMDWLREALDVPSS